MKCSFNLAFLTLFSFLSYNNSADAQTVGGHWKVLHQIDGTTSSEWRDLSLSDAGDVDADGFDDFILGFPLENPGGLSIAGSAYVYSGATGGLIWQFDGSSTQDRFGSSVASAGDVDRDGFGDIIIGARFAAPGGRSSAGSVYLFSGATGNLIWQIDGAKAGDQLGSALALAGDVNRDGMNDVLISAMYASSPGGAARVGSVYVVSAKTGNLIWQLNGFRSGDEFGESIAGAGDVDGDGYEDIIVGTTQVDQGGERAGAAYVFSGATGGLLWQLFGNSRERLGHSVSSASDVNHDGLSDVIVGVPFAGFLDRGLAYVYSVTDNSLIWEIKGAAADDEFGTSIANLGDVNTDGHDDLFIGAPSANPNRILDAGAAYVYCGATQSLIRRIDGLAEGDRLGELVGRAGDLDANGLSDVIVLAPHTDPGGAMDAGSVSIWSLDPFLHLSHDKLSATNGPPIQLCLKFPYSEAGFKYAVLASWAGIGPSTHWGVEVPLSQDALATKIIGNWSPAFTAGTFGFLDNNGQAIAWIVSDLKLIPYVGQTLYLAAVSYEGLTQTGRLSSIVRYLEIVP